MKVFKDAGRAIPIKFLFSLIIRTPQNLCGLWYMMVNGHKLNQMVVSIAAVVLDMVSLLEQSSALHM